MNLEDCRRAASQEKVRVATPGDELIGADEDELRFIGRPAIGIRIPHHLERHVVLSPHIGVLRQGQIHHKGQFFINSILARWVV